MAQFYAGNPQTPTYDADGNMTFDGSTLKTGILDTAGYPLSYAYDAENRLTTVYNRDYRVELTYDYLGRRVRQVTKTNDSALTIKQDLRFVYDGWHMIATLKATTSGSATTYALANAYLWGLDVSGTRGGAGGIGGLLAWYDFTASKSYAPCYDGRGNVSLVYGLTDAHVISEYEYDPYGRNLRTTGYAYASGAWGMVSYDPVNNPFRYQTKWHLQGAIGVDRDYGFTQFDIYDYGKRWYHPKQGRFINRDPIGEKGGRNLYGYVGNDPVNGVDVLGTITQKAYNSAVDELINLYDQYHRLPTGKDNLFNKTNLTNMMKMGQFNWYTETSGESVTRQGLQYYFKNVGCSDSCISKFDNAIKYLSTNYNSWNNPSSNGGNKDSGGNTGGGGSGNTGGGSGENENPTDNGGQGGNSYGTGLSDRVRPPSTFIDERIYKASKIWVKQDGRNVKVFVPVQYIGPDATQNNISLFESAIQKKWSGQVDNIYNVTIVFIEGGYRLGGDLFTNYVYMINAGDAVSWYSDGANIDGTNSMNGVTYMNTNHLLRSSAHEFGHILGNLLHYNNHWARRYPNNIMVVPGGNGVVESINIDQAITKWGFMSDGFSYP